ncbi:hypothetical protein RRG08_044400 [Elysia crispata]|uniref:Uncharacterized protein n=1 Tax=Elysia crispata TaxID=231223 RepID=A0AAE0ZVY2_9GAST|nr:hypothetical protein RRG08_044400 [Elysia crispata]
MTPLCSEVDHLSGDNGVCSLPFIETSGCVGFNEKSTAGEESGQPIYDPPTACPLPPLALAYCMAVPCR